MPQILTKKGSWKVILGFFFLQQSIVFWKQSIKCKYWEEKSEGIPGAHMKQNKTKIWGNTLRIGPGTELEMHNTYHGNTFYIAMKFLNTKNKIFQKWQADAMNFDFYRCINLLI